MGVEVMEDDKKTIARLEAEVLGVKEYFEEIIEFYNEFFDSSKDLEDFLLKVYRFPKNLENGEVVPRIMMNSVQRLVTLADDMELIRPNKSALKSFFIVVCIESLYFNAKLNKMSKYEMVIDFFEKYITNEDQKYILKTFNRSIADDKFVPGEPFKDEVNIEVFSRVINEVRNVFVHQGDYWSFNFAPSNSDHVLMQDIIVEEEKSKGKAKRIYEIMLDYNIFRQICVKGFINFINSYIDENTRF